MCDVLCLGELLIDFTAVKLTKSDKCLFERNAGGAPANVAVQLSRLGTSSGFIGKVGNDSFGRFLTRTLSQNNVSTEGVILDDDALTTLAFVQLDEFGERTFSFYRKPGADTQLHFSELNMELIGKCKVLHFGSLSFTHEPAKSTVLGVLEYARAKGIVISYDPNWRPHLWGSVQEGIAGMRLGLKYCNILKLSEEELILVTGCEDIEEGIESLIAQQIKIALVTLGSKGSVVALPNAIRYVPPYTVEAVDTTGAGDSYLGAFLHRLLSSRKTIDELSIDEVAEWGRFANVAGALCASRIGSISSLPTLDEIEKCLLL